MGTTNIYVILPYRIQLVSVKRKHMSEQHVINTGLCIKYTVENENANRNLFKL